MAESKELVPVGDYNALRPDANALELIHDTLEGGESISEFDLARVKMAAGGVTFWQVPTIDGEESVKEIQGVVLFSKFSRSYWETEYEGGSEPPDCSSADGKHAQPREGYEIPAEKDPASSYLLCDTCQFAEWGSGKGRGQACKKSRQLFLLGPERMLPMVVVLPPTSLKPASQFFLSLADHGINPQSVVVRLSLKKVSKPGVPDFSMVEFHTGERLDETQAKLVSEYAAALRPHFDSLPAPTAAEVAA